MQMPYYDIDIVRYVRSQGYGFSQTKLPTRRVYENAERVRTCNSVITKVPGMFASVNNITDPSTGDVVGYISNAGIPSISNQTVQELDVITPYSVFPTILFNKSVGLAWWRNMVVAKKMQSEFPLPCTGLMLILTATTKTSMEVLNLPMSTAQEFLRWLLGMARSPRSLRCLEV
jgi:hypothetical protein